MSYDHTRAIALHEAAHAIVAHVKQFNVSGITFDPDNAHAEICYAISEDAVIAYFAGREAHLRYAPDASEKAEHGAVDDLCRIAEIADELDLSVLTQDHLRREASSLVERRWCCIQRLVEVIEEHGGSIHIRDGDLVSQILGQITGVSAFTDENVYQHQCAARAMP